MKNKKWILLSILFVTVITGIYVFNDNIIPMNHNVESTVETRTNVVASSVVYETIEDMYSNAQIVVKGKFLGTTTSNTRKFTEKNHVRNELLYDFEITKIINNDTDIKLEANTNIPISRLIGISEDDSPYIQLVDNNDIEIKPGTYLLFLNARYDESLEKYVFVNNSPNHLYKAGAKSDEFKNILQKDALVNITESDVLNIKAKKDKEKK